MGPIRLTMEIYMEFHFYDTPRLGVEFRGGGGIRGRENTIEMFCGCPWNILWESMVYRDTRFSKWNSTGRKHGGFTSVFSVEYQALTVTLTPTFTIRPPTCVQSRCCRIHTASVFAAINVCLLLLIVTVLSQVPLHIANGDVAM